MEAESPKSLPRLKLTLNRTAESIVRRGHPWIYSDSIVRQNREGKSGELAVIYDRSNQFLAIGFYDPLSPIRVRVIHTGRPVGIDADFWKRRLDNAVARREEVSRSDTNGLRLIHGESDAWPGLVLDRYDSTLVLKLYSVAWIERLPMLRDQIVAALKPDRLVLRLSRNLSDRSPVADGSVLFGPPVVEPVTFLETGIRFEADVVRGQKTGFFLDQRENRRRVEELARGAEVLNAFSFSSGFSLYAARGGARSVVDVDISQHALEAGERNFLLNHSDPRIAACRHETVQADVFSWLGEAPPSSWDLVIVDPPSLAKRESERERAIRAYRKLNADAIRLLRRGGVLVAASCSAHVSAEEFFDSVRFAAETSRRRYRELKSALHPADHPIGFPEALYLKCLFLRFD